MDPVTENINTSAAQNIESLGIDLPELGLNPGSSANVTTPGSFANRPAIKPGRAGAATFSSPDTPGHHPK